MDTNKTIVVTGVAAGTIVAVGLIIAASIMSGPPEKGTLPTLDGILRQIVAADERVFNVTDLQFSSNFGALRVNVFHRDGGGVAHQTRVTYYRDVGGVYRYKTGDLIGDRGETWRNGATLWP
jgi:hypothetical protein